MKKCKLVATFLWKKGGDLKPGHSETAFIICLFFIKGSLQENNLAENTKYEVVQDLKKKKKK